ncbi:MULTISPECIES: hypothetical protein [Klebsiella pneumoniae complex]|uniref:hypothetical protein n=1 Tax=Klebsiella pneumoniae complex TaxID=3390273 RepID=UPI0007CCFC3B|nr:Uncharacterised protein [Klebsiella pneumoniae]
MTDITELAQRNELLIANGQQTADLLRHLADNEIDSDYFAVVSECESYGKETDAELSITEFALRAAGYVDALVEALEKAQQRIGKLEKKITDHKRMNQEMAKAMLTPNDSDAAGMEIAALRQRIAELESRTVKLPAERFCPAEYAGSQLWSETEVWNKAITACADALRADGIKVEAE